MTIAQTTKKRILYCEGNTDGTIGGSYFSLLFLVAGLDRKNFEPVVVFRTANALIPRYEAAGIRVIVMPHSDPVVFTSPEGAGLLYRAAYPFLRIVQKAVNLWRFFPSAALRCARLLRNERIDLVHLNNSIIRNNEWMLAAKLARIPCVTHERGINQHYSRLGRYFARRIDCIVCISEAVRKSLLDRGVCPRRTETIYNGIDPSVLQVAASPVEIRERHDIPEEARIIGVVGNIKEWKGQETAVRAMPAILEQHPSTVCLLIGDVAESDRYYYDRLQRLISEHGLEHHIVFTGYTPAVADYLNALEVMLHTSVDPEPFGRVLIEAMALRTPLIGAAAGAVPEIIIDGETGFTFIPGDAESLATAVIRMLRDPARADKMAEAGHHRLLDTFHIDINVARTTELYCDLLAA